MKREILLTFITSSEKETEALAEKLLPSFLAEKAKKQGLVVCLNGEMGCGKTVFVKGVMKALGYQGEVTSPTFSLCHNYEADYGGQAVKVYHLDLYRLKGFADLFSAGVVDVSNEDALVFIEWAANAPDYFPGSVNMNFSYGENGDSRIIEIPDSIG